MDESAKNDPGQNDQQDQEHREKADQLVSRRTEIPEHHARRAQDAADRDDSPAEESGPDSEQ